MGKRTGRTLPNNTTTTYTYDSLSRLTSLTNLKWGSTISSFGYTHDNVGNRLTKTTLEGISTYTYDAIYELTNVVRPDTSAIGYTFDTVSNRIEVNTESYTTNPMNQYTQVGPTKSYSYDDNGSMESKTIDGWMTTYEYDYENRLTRVITPSQGEVSLAYDYAGRLIRRNENTLITNYIYDGDRVIAELGADNTTNVTYLYGTAIDEVLNMTKYTYTWVSDGCGGWFLQRDTAIWYYNHDGLGSVTEVTDWQGNTLERYTYDEYGSFAIRDGGGNPLTYSPSGNRFYFTGREWDFLTGLYYYRARWYDPLLGRFLQKDPVGYTAGDINLYRYVGNNPVNLVDPLGLEAEKGRKGSMTLRFMRIFGPPTVILKWKRGSSGVTQEYLDYLYAIDPEYEEILRGYKDLTLELIFEILGFYGGVGSTMVTVGAITLPYSTLGGVVLIGGGVYMEVQGIVKFVDWARRLGDLINRTRESQEQF